MVGAVDAELASCVTRKAKHVLHSTKFNITCLYSGRRANLRSLAPELSQRFTVSQHRDSTLLLAYCCLHCVQSTDMRYRGEAQSICSRYKGTKCRRVYGAVSDGSIGGQRGAGCCGQRVKAVACRNPCRAAPQVMCYLFTHCTK